MGQDWTSFNLKIAVKSTLEEIYNAWTQSGEVEQWFLETCKYSDENENPIPENQNVKKGDTYEWAWYLYDESEKGRITQANGKDFFQFTFAGECLVDVQLKEIDDHVLVELKQHNIPTDEASKFSIRIGCVQGWTFFLANLKSVYENDFDLRNKNPKLKGINS